MRPCISALLVAFIVACGAHAKAPKSPAEIAAAVDALAWTEGETLELPLSRGSLKSPEQIQQLVGRHAISLWELLYPSSAPPGTEAALYDVSATTQVFFQRLGHGYVRLDDWNDVDADALLKAVTEKWQALGPRRKSAGLPAIHVQGWLERPRLDRATSTISWSFEAIDETGEPRVNRVALVLGRSGFEKLSWIGPRSAVDDGLLAIALQGFAFPAGGRHPDYRDGDPLAAYGVAGLVASVLGVELPAKQGALAAVAIFAGKFGLLLLVPITLALGWWMRRFFRSPPRA
jgi:hypothetical protein